MPLHVRKRSKSAVGFFLENNHSLSNDPYLPSFPPHPSSSLQPRPSQPDKHRCPMWEGGVGGGGMGGHHWRKSKQTHIDSSHLNFEILEQKKRGYLLVLNNELSVMESWFCLENLSRCSRHWCNWKGYWALAFVRKALTLDAVVHDSLWRWTSNITLQIRDPGAKTLCQRCCEAILDVACHQTSPVNPVNVCCSSRWSWESVWQSFSWLLPIHNTFFFLLELVKRVGIIMLTCYCTGLAKKLRSMPHASPFNKAN